MITKEELLKKYNISEELFQSASISWQELTEIYKDFSEIKYDKYTKILSEFIREYLSNTDVSKIHSFRSRVKDPEHLIVKIIRKKQENFKKYEKLDKNNYEKFLTDLIGIRCFILFKSDWKEFHQYLLSQFENSVEYYITDPILSFDEDAKHNYIAERPKVHIRNGDNREIYENVLAPDCVIDNKVYGSVHYIIKYKGVYLEIQVRTLFEEGWGEVDHVVVYPYYKDDPILTEYTELLNRLSGLADEMSGFFTRLKKLEVEHMSNKPITEWKKNIDEDSDNRTDEENSKLTMDETQKVQKGKTIGECLATVLEE